MLARLQNELPRDGHLYEPKWDGFRCLAFRGDGDVDLRSRNDRPLARYFPEVVEGLLALHESRFVLDGELVGAHDGRLDFPTLRPERELDQANAVQQLHAVHPAKRLGWRTRRAPTRRPSPPRP